jgi:hypothetical protein
MALTNTQVSDIESGYIRTLQGGRLELDSTTSLHWEPAAHGSVALWNGKTWVIVTLNSSVFLSNVSSDVTGSLLFTGTNYDVFAQYTSPTSFVLCTYPWASNSTRDSTFGRFQGVLVQDPTTSLGRQRRYLGTIRLYPGPYFADNDNQRFIVNLNNRRTKPVVTYNTSAVDWSFNSSNAWVEYRQGGSQIRGEFISLVAGVGLSGYGSLFKGWDHEWTAFGISANSTGAPLIVSWDEHSPTRATYNYHFLPVYAETVLGYNYITMVYKSNSAALTNASNGGYANGIVWIEV